jgi:hypothetical protein
MHWNNYLACFFAGAFLANSIPHYVYGIAGDRFPTPFAKPPGKGLSSPTLNVVWGLLNVVVGYVLIRTGKLWSAGDLGLVIFFAGITVMSLMLGANFAKKHAL